MLKYVQSIGILFILTACTLAILYYPTDARVKRGILEGYNKEMATLSGNIQEDRKERERLRNEWQKQDNYYSGKINESKKRLEKTKLCLEGQSFDCQKANEQALHSLIPQTYADNLGTASGAIVPPPPKGYSKKHTLILTGSHDYRIYSNRNGAIWKNNNPSGLTWGVSNTLKGLWNDSGIKYSKGTYRPKNEGGNYILFATIEEGLRAKVIAIRERWGKATVGHFLSGWGTDSVELSFDKSKIIGELTEQEFIELLVQQLKKESPGLVSQLVNDGIIVIE